MYISASFYRIVRGFGISVISAAPASYSVRYRVIGRMCIGIGYPKGIIYTADFFGCLVGKIISRKKFLFLNVTKKSVLRLALVKLKRNNFLLSLYLHKLFLL